MVVIARDSSNITRFLLVDSSGNLYTNLKAPTVICNGQKTIPSAGSSDRLRTSLAVLSITVKAHKANTGNVFVGDSGVTSANGFILSPGDSVSFDIDDVADVYIDAAINGEGVSWIAVA